MSARRWIVGVGERGCQNYNCNAPRGKVVRGAKKSLDAATGVYRYACPTCEKASEIQLSAYKDRRTCEGCQRVRDVTVRIHSDGKEFFAKRCDACEAMLSALKHLSTARVLAEKAREIYRRHGVKAPGWAP